MIFRHSNPDKNPPKVGQDQQPLGHEFTVEGDGLDREIIVGSNWDEFYMTMEIYYPDPVEREMILLNLVDICMKNGDLQALATLDPAVQREAKLAWLKHMVSTGVLANQRVWLTPSVDSGLRLTDKYMGYIIDKFNT